MVKNQVLWSENFTRNMFADFQGTFSVTLKTWYTQLSFSHDPVFGRHALFCSVACPHCLTALQDLFKTNWRRHREMSECGSHSGQNKLIGFFVNLEVARKMSEAVPYSISERIFTNLLFWPCGMNISVARRMENVIFWRPENPILALWQESYSQFVMLLLMRIIQASLN